MRRLNADSDAVRSIGVPKLKARPPCVAFWHSRRCAGLTIDSRGRNLSLSRCLALRRASNSAISPTIMRARIDFPYRWAHHIGCYGPCFGAGFPQRSVGQRSDALGGVAGVARRCEIGRIIAVTGNDVIDGIGLTGREWHGGCSVSVRPKGAAPN